MKSICFFCHFHNGDMFHIKSFIEEVCSTLKTKIYIAHPNNPIITSDLDVEYINLPVYWNNDYYNDEETIKRHQKHSDILNNCEHTKFIDTEECFYINTWIGGYFSPENEYDGECSLRGFHRMFSLIYDEINSKFGTNLKINSVENYYPFVDYSKFDCKNIDRFLENNQTKKVLVCNGPALSYQTTYNTDMSEILEPLAIENPDKTFVATKKFNTDVKNIVFTNDIIQMKTCDLNQISYLSRFCYLIVGRNSGPFCFTLTKENIDDENKTFLAYGSRETDCLLYNIDIRSTFIFDYFNTVNQLSQSISELI